MPHLAIAGGAPVRAAPYPEWPVWDQAEIDAVAEVVRGGRWGGFPEPGPRAAAFAAVFAAFQGAKHGICMANGTVTLTIAQRAAGVGLGDEVIVPAYTFVATAYAVLEAGAIPVMVDADPANYCIDPAALEAAITPRTRAVIPVHVGSLMADMDAIMEIAGRHNLVVVEDCAHAHGARWRDRGAGGIGDFGSFSMQSFKLLTSGEGGILLTNDDELAETCHSLIDCGRPKDPAGEHYHLGANLRLSELQAALLAAGLRRLPEQTAAREENAAYLDEALSELPGVRVLRRDDRLTRRAVYSYICAIDPAAFGGANNARVCAALQAEGIPAGRGYPSLLDNPIFRPVPDNHPVAKLFPDRFDFDAAAAPVARRAYEREAVWIDQRVFLGDRQGMDDVVAALRKVQRYAAELSRRGAAPIRWTFADILLVLLASALASVALVLGVGVALGQVVPDPRAFFQANLVVYAAGIGIAIYGIVFLAVYLLIVRRRGAAWRAIGFRRPPLLALLLAPLLGFGQLLAVALLNQLVLRFAGAFENPQVAMITGGQGFSWRNFVLMLLLAGVVAPLVEETFFRGLLYGWLRARLPVVAAVALSAALFALVHFIPILLPALFAMGLILALAYELSGSLWLAILLHAIQNSLAVTLIFVALAFGMPVTP